MRQGKFLLLVGVASVFCFQYGHEYVESKCDTEECGSPLFLTPLIEAGELELARNMSEIPELPNSGNANIKLSYSGFFTVNKEFNSNLFFWFFPARNGDVNAPLMLWLQGGPGASSLFGSFAEIGPYGVDKDGKLIDLDYSWGETYSLLFIDNPVRAGFSFTDSEEGMSRDEDAVADNLYAALSQFFQVFPDYGDNSFFVAGESYGGKYVPAICSRIHKENPTASVPINLVGILIGDGWCDPLTHMPEYGSMLFNMGLADQGQRQQVDATMAAAVSKVHAGLYEDAFHLWNSVWMDYPLEFPSLFTNITGSTNTVNMMESVPDATMGYMHQYIISPSVRQAIHVGDVPFGKYGVQVYSTMFNDFMHSIKPLMPTLIENYRVLVYNGQLDLVVGVAPSEGFYSSLMGAAYDKAAKTIWKVDPADAEVAGFVRSLGNFTQAVVRGAGHMVPTDQPRRAYDLMDRFVSGRGF